MSTRLPRQPPRNWRTFVITLVGFGVLLLGFRWAAAMTEGKDLYAILRDGVVLLALGFGARSVGQDLAGGGGVKGAIKALFTDAKPDLPAETPK
jgi:hypothetical protein